MELTDKQYKFIDTYLKCKNIKDVCDKLKISRSNAYQQYLNDSKVKLEINRRCREILDHTTAYLRDNLNECSKILIDIAQDPTRPVQARISAINSIFNNYNKLAETTNIVNRLEELEQYIESKEK